MNFEKIFLRPTERNADDTTEKFPPLKLAVEGKKRIQNKPKQKVG